MASPLTIDIRNGTLKDQKTDYSIGAEDDSIVNLLKVSRGDASGIIKNRYANQLINQGINLTKSYINFNIAHSYLKDGNYFNQRNMQNAMQQVETTMSLVSGIGMGFAVGGIAGGVVGGVVSISSLIFQEYQNSFEYTLDVQKQNASATFNRSNLGTILTNGSR